MAEEIKVGDRVLVEQAWEDEAGHYHDDYATVVNLDDQQNVVLKFEDEKIQEFLEGSDGYTLESLEKV